MPPADPILAAACEELHQQGVASIEIRQLIAARNATLRAVDEVLRYVDERTIHEPQYKKMRALIAEKFPEVPA